MNRHPIFKTKLLHDYDRNSSEYKTIQSILDQFRINACLMPYEADVDRFVWHEGKKITVGTVERYYEIQFFNEEDAIIFHLMITAEQHRKLTEESTLW